METKRIKAVEAVLDWSLWPRHEANDLDATNVARLKRAMEAGITLPPIIVNKSDYRIVDGFHRVKACLSLYGDGAEIDAQVVSFRSDAEMFIESARINSQQGLPLSPRDKVHVINRARKQKTPWPVVAESIGMNVDVAKDFFKKRTAKTQSGETIPLPGGAAPALHGKVLTDAQEHYVRHQNGTIPELHARMLLNALRSDSMIINDNARGLLSELRDVIDVILEDR